MPATRTISWNSQEAEALFRRLQDAVGGDMDLNMIPTQDGNVHIEIETKSHKLWEEVKV